MKHSFPITTDEQRVQAGALMREFTRTIAFAQLMCLIERQKDSADGFLRKINFKTEFCETLQKSAEYQMCAKFEGWIQAMIQEGREADERLRGIEQSA